MITIEKRNGYWELYVAGGLMTYNESLQVVTSYLDSLIEEEIEEEIETKESSIEEQSEDLQIFRKQNKITAQ